METLPLTPMQGWLILACFGVFFFVVTAVFTGRGDRATKEGFLVAGRDLGWVRTAFSVAATWIWAPALFVAAQQGYEHGWVGVFWFTVPNIACLIIFAFFAQKARVMFPHGFTLSAAARDRYSRRVQIMYIIALIGLAIASFAVQLLAGAVVITALTGISFALVTVALSAIALSYTLYAGLKGSVVTDWLQMGIIALVGFGLSLAVVLAAGVDTLAAGANGIDGTYTSLTSGPGAALFWSFGLSTTIGLLSGPFGDQSFWQRAWSVNPKDVRKTFILGAGIFAIVPLVMSMLGFAAAGAKLEVISPTLTNLTAVIEWLPAWTIVAFLLYVFAGLVSTMSSQLSALSTFAAHDMLPAGRTYSDERTVKLARISMVALAVAAVALANIPGIAVVQLFIFYGTLRACTLIPTIMMLTWPRKLSEAGAFYGILGSLITALPLSAYGNLNKDVPFIVAGSLCAIGVSGLVTVLASIAASRGHEDRAEKRVPVESQRSS